MVSEALLCSVTGWMDGDGQLAWRVQILTSLTDGSSPFAGLEMTMRRVRDREANEEHKVKTNRRKKQKIEKKLKLKIFTYPS